MSASTRSRRAVAFAVPGDPSTLTGGSIYDARLIAALRSAGRKVTHVVLPDGFPDPAPSALARSVAALSAVPATDPLIVDGLAFGAIPTEALARIASPLVALVHHPLALETGLAPARATVMAACEAANLGLAAHVLVPSPHTAQVLQRDYGVPPDRITVALPGVDRPVGAQAPEIPPLVLSVGLLARRKGHDVLIRALARIADLDWRAVIVGRNHEPGMVEELAALVDESGLACRVTLAGEVSAARLAALYRHATLFALASRYEGYGMAFAEAMIHGLPVVACRTGAVADTVPATAGLLVPPDDAAAFSGALRRVLADDDLRRSLAKGAKAEGARLPDWSGTAGRVGGVLDRL
ncbi:MAG: glycosyltransferase family 4 protein [Rhodobacteraceae bacterium]|nr:glycosyltransferase family 4 protein [Paracoccaceae bacterium]